MRVFVIAVENSGDQLGAQLISAMRAKQANVEIAGIGGTAMAAQGVTGDVDISALSILGFVEALRVYPLVLKRVRETVAAVMADGPDAVVLIDSWGFMVRVAKGLKRAGYSGQIIKYVAPQVWAMREGRAKVLARYVDHLLSIHSFDAPYFTRHGLPTTHVGNPMFDTDYRAGDADAFRHRHGLGEATILGVMFGSRAGEVQRLSKTLAEAAARVKSRYPDVKIIAPIATTISEQMAASQSSDPNFSDIIFVPQAEFIDAIAAMDVALACSGTVTTQLACAGVPTVVAYRLAPLTYFVAKQLFKPSYISIVNIAADAPLMPEFVQDAARPSALADALVPYISTPSIRAEASEKLLSQTTLMQGKGGLASMRAASKILDLLSES